MNRVKPVPVTVVYANKPDSPQHLQAAYDFLFNLARRELLQQQQGKSRQAGKPDTR